MQTFAIQYIHEGKTRTAYLEAETWDDAEAQLSSLRQGGTVSGSVVERFSAFRSPVR